MRILLIEPDRVLARIYTDALANHGYDVRLARGANEAIVFADTHTPDLVILELQLGVHNGVEFLQEFRSHEDWAKIPVIIHTLSSERMLKRYATNWRSLGAVKVLPKTSTTLQKLLTEVSGVLAHEG